MGRVPVEGRPLPPLPAPRGCSGLRASACRAPCRLGAEAAATPQSPCPPPGSLPTQPPAYPRHSLPFTILWCFVRFASVLCLLFSVCPSPGTGRCLDGLCPQRPAQPRNPARARQGRAPDSETGEGDHGGPPRRGLGPGDTEAARVSFPETERHLTGTPRVCTSLLDPLKGTRKALVSSVSRVLPSPQGH